MRDFSRRIVGRRNVLKGIGLAPVAAKAAADELATVGMEGFAHHGSYPPPVLEAQVGAVPARARRFLSFDEWFAAKGEAELRDQAKNVTQMDPEIAAMRLPLATKVRMNEERFFRRLVAQRRSWVSRVLKTKGFLEEWD